MISRFSYDLRSQKVVSQGLLTKTGVFSQNIFTTTLLSVEKPLSTRRYTMSSKSLISTLLITLLISSFWLTSITHFSSAQNSFEISGYLLDSNGQGVASAMIIFNVPDIVPAVYSDSSGYYKIYVPAGTYHINVCLLYTSPSPRD